MKLCKKDFDTQSIMYLYQFLNQMGTYTSYVAIAAMSAMSGLFFVNLSLFFTARHVGGVIAFWYAGGVINRFGEQSVMFIGNLVAAVSVLAIIVILSQNHLLALPFLFLIGFCENLTLSALHSRNAKAVVPDSRLKLNHNLQFIEFITMCMGASVGGVLIQYVGISSALLFDAITFFACGILAFLLMSEKTEVKTAPAVIGPPIHNGIRLISVAESKARIILFSELILVTVACVYNLIEVKYYLSILNLEYSHIGPFFLLVSMPGLLLGSFLVRRVNLKINAIIILLFILIHAFLSMSFSKNLIQAGISILSVVACTTIIRSIIISSLQGSVTQEYLPGVLSLRFGMHKIVFICFTPVAGQLLEKYGILTTIQFAYLALFPFCILSGYFLFKKGSAVAPHFTEV